MIELEKLAHSAAKQVGCKIYPVEGRDTFYLVDDETKHPLTVEDGVTLDHIIGLCECRAHGNAEGWLDISHSITEQAVKLGIKMPMYITDVTSIA